MKEDDPQAPLSRDQSSIPSITDESHNIKEAKLVHVID